MGRLRKLTDDQCKEILAQGDASAKDLAKLYGVSYVTILKVRQGKGAYGVAVEGPALTTHGTLVLPDDPDQG